MHSIEWPETNTVELAKRLRVLPGFVWLDSSDVAHAEGRYSFLSALPQEQVRVPNASGDPLATIAKLTPAPQQQRPTTLGDISIPHWIGWIAYDALAPAEKRSLDDPDLVWFGRYSAVVCVDHKEQRCVIVGDDENACKQLLASLDRSPAAIQPPRIEQLMSDAPSDHASAIQEALELIAAGEIYQVNLARRWCVPCKGDVFALWLAMREASPVPLGMYLNSGTTTVLASTMERFLRWDRATRNLICSPIKGTVARQSDANAQALTENPKERAEHTMIVDLIRNDLGRVAEPGSVQLEQPFRVEPFAGLSHLISTVRCRTRSDANLRSIIEATFPPGSVTGTPKIRAQQIIEQLEAHARGIYCGALGFIDREGGLSLSVAIRTAVQHNEMLDYWAGGGIVEASNISAEIAETELKARRFLQALDSISATH